MNWYSTSWPFEPFKVEIILTVNRYWISVDTRCYTGRDNYSSNLLPCRDKRDNIWNIRFLPVCTKVNVFSLFNKIFWTKFLELLSNKIKRFLVWYREHEAMISVTTPTHRERDKHRHISIHFDTENFDDDDWWRTMNLQNWHFLWTKTQMEVFETTRQISLDIIY